MERTREAGATERARKIWGEAQLDVQPKKGLEVVPGRSRSLVMALAEARMRRMQREHPRGVDGVQAAGARAFLNMLSVLDSAKIEHEPRPTSPSVTPTILRARDILRDIVLGRQDGGLDGGLKEWE